MSTVVGIAFLSAAVLAIITVIASNIWRSVRVYLIYRAARRELRESQRRYEAAQ
jgi:hypothetical protein